ncbi:2,3-diketo-L-gulonate TRAP transporter small permease protein YiaM [Aquimixticola soesokkakensis]|uniref:TRAP transporter small permease protein n=1 Tax=Aquimixticola soesokkakensis TaxID=1519096 RepID=A0A1Y5TAS8_9RHOB|nr:TRAP transporter small permease [Aquimixticola soesokkakensis]SLN57697.1 2,3-diketo-L-gulonate TRAP transporter small permease protein YiaM [Aquimixticola soesokkakensis]
MASQGHSPASGTFWDTFEESVIAFILGAMTLVTFINVVLRYVFNHSFIWGLEVTLILFAWLVLLGISYGFKKTMHLGVDAIINLLPTRAQRVTALVSALACLVYALLLLKGAWDYWAPYAGLDRTAGRWFPLGFEATRDQAWYVTDQVPMIWVFKWLEPLINMGETYDKLPRVIPYFVLPFGILLLVVRVAQAGLRIIRGEQKSLIVSHEAEEDVERAAIDATPDAKEV